MLTGVWVGMHWSAQQQQFLFEVGSEGDQMARSLRDGPGLRPLILVIPSSTQKWHRLPVCPKPVAPCDSVVCCCVMNNPRLGGCLFSLDCSGCQFRLGSADLKLPPMWTGLLRAQQLGWLGRVSWVGAPLSAVAHLLRLVQACPQGVLGFRQQELKLHGLGTKLNNITFAAFYWPKPDEGQFRLRGRWGGLTSIPPKFMSTSNLRVWPYLEIGSLQP